MGLSFPKDLAAWQSWQRRRHRLRWVKSSMVSAVRPVRETTSLVLHSGSEAPEMLVVVDAAHTTFASALVRVLDHLDLERTAVLGTRDLTTLLPAHPWRRVSVDPGGGPDPSLLPALRATLAVGDFLEAGALARRVSLARRATFYVVQHGLLTPMAPPLPPEAHLLAWSDEDARFWWSGRPGSSTVVGSELLWSAARSARTTTAPGAPTYLGQLHGAELRRRDLERAARRFCRRWGAIYRPHPSEHDVVSRLVHASWRRGGITIDESGRPLADNVRGVVSVFSTGVLEAAALGIPSWVDFPNPPRWLAEFWERYGMRPYGGDPTPAPARPAEEPAQAIARILEAL